MDESTQTRLIPCEKHAAILGRQAARMVQRPDERLTLQWEIGALINAIRRGGLGTCSDDKCVEGDGA